jgi:hypothetical protein
LDWKASLTEATEALIDAAALDLGGAHRPLEVAGRNVAVDVDGRGMACETLREFTLHRLVDEVRDRGVRSLVHPWSVGVIARRRGSWRGG